MKSPLRAMSYSTTCVSSSKRKPMKLLVKKYDPLHFGRVTEKLLNQGFEKIGQGSFRVTYARGKVVIKIPYNQAGFEDNLTEAYNWRKYKSTPNTRGFVFAPCRLLPDGSLMMVKVEGIRDWNTIPFWAYKIDGTQCGYHKGKLVAYDYACDAGHNWEAKIHFLGEN